MKRIDNAHIVGNTCFRFQQTTRKQLVISVNSWKGVINSYSEGLHIKEGLKLSRFNRENISVFFLYFLESFRSYAFISKFLDNKQYTIMNFLLKRFFIGAYMD